MTSAKLWAAHGRNGAVVMLCGVLAVMLAGCPGTDEGDAMPPPVLASPTFAAEDVRFVSPTGNDDWPGTEQRPWRTLSRAFPAMLPGQLLWVRDGTYRERVDRLALHKGTPQRPITVGAYPGEEPLVEGIVWLRGLMYWDIVGLDVTWDDDLPAPPKHMVKLTDGIGWSWRDSEMWGARAGANVLILGTEPDEPAEWSFAGNCVHDPDPLPGAQQASNLAVGAAVGRGSGSISRNLVFDSDRRGRNIRIGSGRSGPDDLTVSWNTVSGASVALTLNGDTSGTSVEHNLFAAPRSGTVIRAYDVEGDDNRIQGNIALGSERFYRPESADRVTTAANVLVDDASLEATELGCAGYQPSTVASAYGRDAGR